MPCINFGEVLHDVSYLRYSSGIHVVLEAVLLKLHVKLAPRWVLIRVNFDLIQKIGPKVGGGCSFVSGPFFARLQYMYLGPAQFSVTCSMEKQFSFVPRESLGMRLPGQTYEKLVKNCSCDQLASFPS